MADLRIVDAPEIPTENITGEEKLPTGGSGNYSISLDSLADYTKTKKDLADNTSVDGKVNGVRQELDAHIEDLLNPHQVTKGQIGLGNVDNTADADKPVSNSTQAAIISAVSPKADKTYVDTALSSKTDKTYVDNQLTLKANKVDVYTKSETYTKQESSDLVSSSISTALAPVNSSLDLAKRGVANRYDSSLIYNSNERVVLANGDIVKSTIDGNTNDPNVNMTGWVNDAELQRIHNKSSATLTDYLLPAEIANSTTTDLSAKLQAINDENVISKLRVPSGVWYINSPVVFNRDFSWDFDPDAFFKFGINGSITFCGYATLIGKPTSNISNDTRVINLVTGINLSPFDLICIYNPTDGSFTPQRTNYRAGEYMKVATVIAGAITTFGKTYENYDASVVDIYKINPIHIDFNRFNILAENTAASNPVIFSFCEGLDISNYYNYGSATAGLYLDRCYDVTVSSSSPKNNSALVGLNYGVSLANCQNVRLYGITPLAARHGVAVGGGNGICSVPCREIYIDKSVLKTSSTLGIGAADFHGNVSDSVYDGCKIDHGVFSGKNLTVRNSFVNNRETDAACLIFQDLVGGEVNIENVTVTTTRGSTSSIGYLMFTLLNDLKEDLVVNIKNLKVKGSASSVSSVILFRCAADVVITKRIIINIDGLDCRLGDHGAFLYIEGSTAQPAIPNVEINMSNIRSNKTGVYYVHPTTTAKAAKLTLPTQKGSQLILMNGEATGKILAPAINFPYLYPITPVLIPSFGTDGTWTVDVDFNNKPIGVIISTLTTATTRLAIVSKDVLPTGKTAKLGYTVGI